MSHDVHIRGGLVIDGTGAPGRTADVAIDGRPGGRGGRAPRARPAARTIDADGRIVCPGFVDLHTHYDIQAFWDPTLSPSPLHGVTTAIAGNCGFSVAPLAASEAEYLMRMLARVEGMPLDSLAAATDWGWTSFGSYLARLDGQVMPNLGFLVGHSAIRRVVMGAAASERVATDDEVAAMRAAAGREPRRGRARASRRRGPPPTSTATGSRCRRASPTSTSCSSCATRSAATPARRSSSSPASATSPSAEGELMGRMSAAADRPLNWNVLVVIAGLADKVATQLGASDRAAELGGRVLGLTIPMSVRPRLSFASGFLLDTIPGWQGPMTGATTPSGWPACARPRRAGPCWTRRVTPSWAWPTSASTC